MVNHIRRFLMLSAFILVAPNLMNIAQASDSPEQLQEILEAQPMIVEEYFRQADELLTDNQKILNYLGTKLERCYFYLKPCPKFEEKMKEFNRTNQEELAQFREISLQFSDSLFNLQILLRDEKVRDQNREEINEYNSVMLERFTQLEENLERKYGKKAPQYLYQASQY